MLVYMWGSVHCFFFGASKGKDTHFPNFDIL